jgi:hypothetical protein
LTNLIAAKLLREDEEGSTLQRAVREGLSGNTLKFAVSQIRSQMGFDEGFLGGREIAIFRCH